MHKYKVNQWIFVILIPIFMLIIAFIFDFALMFIQNTRVELTTKKIIKDTLTYSKDDYYEDIKEFFEKNKISTDVLTVQYNEEDGDLTISNSHPYTSFFGKLIGVNYYRCDVNFIGHKDGENIIIKEVQDE